MVGDDDLRCPATGARLHPRRRGLRTEDGARRYPIVDGVPVLVADERRACSRASQASAPQRARGARAPPRGRAAARLGQRRHRTAGRPAARSCSRARPRVLVVGGGTLGAGMAPLLDDPAVDATETDVWLGPRTTLVCDGHDLPFADAHVRRGRLPGGARARARPAARRRRDPPRAARRRPRSTPRSRSCSRSTRARNDLTRYTYVGQRRLFRELRRGGEPAPSAGRRWRSRGRCATSRSRSSAAAPPQRSCRCSRSGCRDSTAG